MVGGIYDNSFHSAQPSQLFGQNGYTVAGNQDYMADASSLWSPWGAQDTAGYGGIDDALYYQNANGYNSSFGSGFGGNSGLDIRGMVQDAVAEMEASRGYHGGGGYYDDYHGGGYYKDDDGMGFGETLTQLALVFGLKWLNKDNDDDDKDIPGSSKTKMSDKQMYKFLERVALQIQKDFDADLDIDDIEDIKNNLVAAMGKVNPKLMDIKKANKASRADLEALAKELYDGGRTFPGVERVELTHVELEDLTDDVMSITEKEYRVHLDEDDRDEIRDGLVQAMVDEGLDDIDKLGKITKGDKKKLAAALYDGYAFPRLSDAAMSQAELYELSDMIATQIDRDYDRTLDEAEKEELRDQLVDALDAEGLLHVDKVGDITLAQRAALAARLYDGDKIPNVDQLDLPRADVHELMDALAVQVEKDFELDKLDGDQRDTIRKKLVSAMIAEGLKDTDDLEEITGLPSTMEALAKRVYDDSDFRGLDTVELTEAEMHQLANEVMGIIEDRYDVGELDDDQVEAIRDKLASEMAKPGVDIADVSRLKDITRQQKRKLAEALYDGNDFSVGKSRVALDKGELFELSEAVVEQIEKDYKVKLDPYDREELRDRLIDEMVAEKLRRAGKVKDVTESPKKMEALAKRLAPKEDFDGILDVKLTHSEMHELTDKLVKKIQKESGETLSESDIEDIRSELVDAMKTAKVADKDKLRDITDSTSTMDELVAELNPVGKGDIPGMDDVGLSQPELEKLLDEAAKQIKEDSGEPLTGIDKKAMRQNLVKALKTLKKDGVIDDDLDDLKNLNDLDDYERLALADELSNYTGKADLRLTVRKLVKLLEAHKLIDSKTARSGEFKKWLRDNLETTLTGIDKDVDLQMFNDILKDKDRYEDFFRDLMPKLKDELEAEGGTLKSLTTRWDEDWADATPLVHSAGMLSWLNPWNYDRDYK
ncbi:MAG: hypothetical protein KTR14_01970 [Vampirovibrio sp.]|nr:hypothetical protein [Vampirovibrio sp.]